ncbi:MAG: MarR family transcriptional regulator [Caldilineaceae bacterium]
MLQMVPEKSISNELVDNVLDFIGVLSSTVRNVRYSFEVASDLNAQELMVLAELSEHGPMPVKDIVSRLVGVSPSTLTRILDRLEKGGLIKRALNPEDRRSFRVSLTDHGAVVVEDYTGHLEQVVRQMLYPLTPAERMMLAEMQTTMVSALDRGTKMMASEVAA